MFKKLFKRFKKSKTPRIVYCKDCLRSDDSTKGIDDIYCRKHLNWVEKEGFCSYGVRSDTE